MKKTAIILALIFGISLMHSCEKEEEAVLNLGDAVAPVLTNPEDGESYVLTEEEEDEVLFSFEWTEADYKAEGLPQVRYLIQADKSARNWQVADSIRDIAETRETSHEITVGRLNTILARVGLEPFEEEAVSFRVIAFLTRASDHAWLHSASVGVNITTFEAMPEEVKPIYMLGDGTPAGWDNTAAIEMYHIEEGSFALVERLGDDGDMVKFISILGEWAPQWGAEPGGTATEGQLAYRPTEDDPDPDPINIAELEPGDYRVVADTAALTYHITKATEVLYLLGSATEAGWDNEAALEMTREAPGMFSIVTDLTAGEDMYFKFIEVLGQWAPQYGTDEEGTWEEGNLIYRPTEDVDDPLDIPAPETSGSYLIEVNLSNRTYQLTPE